MSIGLTLKIVGRAKKEKRKNSRFQTSIANFLYSFLVFALSETHHPVSCK